MQRFFNEPSHMVDEMVKGFLEAHSDIVEAAGNPRVVKARGAPRRGRVGIVTGGGSGHKPAFIGYVGKNMVDAVAVGEIFSSPTAKSFYDAIRAADGGAGVACLYGNYAGDNMNVKMAMDMAAEDGIKVMSVVATDDVASAPRDERNDRRGLAGGFMMWKAGAAKAALGGSLEEVVVVAQKAIDNTRSVGIGLAPCTIPEVGKPNFRIDPGRMELGIGHHGEPGIKVVDLRSADEIAEMLVDIVLSDLPFNRGDEVVILLSGLGATPVMELYILYNEIASLIADREIRIHRPFVGNLATSLEMMGAMLTITRLDDELKRLIDMDCECVGLRQCRQPQ